MLEEFVPYEQALRLKELGFDEPCFGYYVDRSIDLEWTFTDSIHFSHKESILAPLYQQAFRWLLNKHNLYTIVIPTINMDWTFKTMTVVEGIVEVPPYKHVDSNDYGTKCEAELYSLKKLIEMIDENSL